MSTELATIERPETALRTITPEQKELVRNMVFKGANDDELGLFFFECQRRGVHPLDRLIHPQKRRDGEDGHKVVFVTSIDYFRSESETTGDYAGIDEPIYEGIIDLADSNKAPELAKVTVYRFINNERVPFTGVARWREFYPGDKQGQMWRKMPFHMLAKCAEVQARRLAWPKRLGGLYIPEEMLHDDAPADRPQSKAATVQPPKQSAPPPSAPAPKEDGKPKIKDPDAPCSDKQATAIHSMLSKLNIEAEYHHSYAAQTLGLDTVPQSMFDLTKGQASELIDLLNNELK